MISFKKKAVYLCALVGALAATPLLLIRQADQKRLGIERRTDETRIALAGLQDVLGGNRNISAKTVELKRAIAGVESNLSLSGETDRVIEEIWHLAETNSLQTQAIATLPPRHFLSYGEQDLELNLCGDFSGFYQFWTQLENLKRVTRVKKLKLTHSDSGEGEITAAMTIGVFFQSETTDAQ